MDQPNWELSFPTPQRLFTDVVDDDLLADTSKSGGKTTTITDGTLVLAQQPSTPSLERHNLTDAKNSPMSSAVTSKHSSAQGGGHSRSNRVPDRTNCPRVFIPARSKNAADLSELHASIYATIDQPHDTYVCIHDIVDYVCKNIMAPQKPIIKWRHLNGRVFLFQLPDEETRDRFIGKHPVARLGTAIIKFTPWQMSQAQGNKQSDAKVWLKLTGLPVEHFTHSTAEFVVSPFGRLHRCNVEKKSLYIGAFYVNIDCHSVDDINKEVIVHLDDVGDKVVSIEKMYACPLDIYNAQQFNETSTPYDEILYTLIARGKLIAL